MMTITPPHDQNSATGKSKCSQSHRCKTAMPPLSLSISFKPNIPMNLQVSPIHSHETQISSRHVQPPRMPCPHPLRLGHLRCRLGNGGPPPGRFWGGGFHRVFRVLFFCFVYGGSIGHFTHGVCGCSWRFYVCFFIGVVWVFIGCL